MQRMAKHARRHACLFYFGIAIHDTPLPNASRYPSGRRGERIPRYDDRRQTQQQTNDWCKGKHHDHAIHGQPCPATDINLGGGGAFFDPEPTSKNTNLNDNNADRVCFRRKCSNGHFDAERKRPQLFSNRGRFPVPTSEASADDSHQSQLDGYEICHLADADDHREDHHGCV